MKWEVGREAQKGGGICIRRSSQVALVVKNPPANAGDIRDTGLIPGSRRSLGEGLATTPVFLPKESLGQRNLVGYRLWRFKESDTTEATYHAHMNIRIHMADS